MERFLSLLSDDEDDAPAPHSPPLNDDHNMDVDNVLGEVLEETPEAQEATANPPEETLQGKLHDHGLHREYTHRESPFCPFANFTQAVLAILFRKHRFSKALYADLVRLLRHPSFNVGDIYGSYDTLVKSYLGLPLLPYREYQVTEPLFPAFLRLFLCFSFLQVPSTSIKRKSESIFIMDMKSMVRRMLMDPKLGTLLRFPTKEAKSSEYIHGSVMRESPLFNLLDPQVINTVSYHLGDHVTFQSDDKEMKGRIVSYFKNLGQDGEVLAEIRPLKTVNQNLVACTALLTVSPACFLRKENIVGIR